jgi:hypothetical protein
MISRLATKENIQLVSEQVTKSGEYVLIVPLAVGEQMFEKLDPGDETFIKDLCFQVHK